MSSTGVYRKAVLIDLRAQSVVDFQYATLNYETLATFQRLTNKRSGCPVRGWIRNIYILGIRQAAAPPVAIVPARHQGRPRCGGRCPQDALVLW